MKRVKVQLKVYFKYKKYLNRNIEVYLKLTNLLTSRINCKCISITLIFVYILHEVYLKYLFT